MADPVQDAINERRAELLKTEAMRAEGGPTIEAAIAARRAELEQMQGKTTVANVGDGIVYRNQDGTLGYTSPGYSTNDQARISEMLQGVLPADLMQRDIDEQRIAENPIAARAYEVNRGAPFVGSYLDEAVGAFSPQAGTEMRRTSEAMQRQRPGQTAALNVLGGVAWSAPAAVAAAPTVAAAAPQSMLGRGIAGATAGATAGGVEGAIWGYGEGQGQERLRNAGRQGTIGAIGGGVLGAALPFGANLVEGLVRRYRGSDVATIARELNISRPAARMLKTAFENNDEDAIARIMRAGEDATLADAGVSGQALLDAAAQTGGEPLSIVRRATETRARDALDVVNQGLDDALGPVQGPRAAARSVAASTRPERNAAYTAAYALPINYADDTGRAIEGVLDRIPEDVLARAIKEANEEMRANGVRNMQILFDADTGRFAEMPNVQQLDEIKKALGNMGAEAVDQFGRKTRQGARYSMLSDDLRDALKAATGGEDGSYAAALRVGRDKITRDQGLALGLDMLRNRNITREVFKEEFASLPKDAQQMVKIGLRAHIDETLANVRAIASSTGIEDRQARMAALNLLSSPASREKISVMLGDQAERFFKQIDRATSALEMKASVAASSPTGIRTSIREQGQEMLQPGALGELARGNPVDATRRLTQMLLNTTPQADAGRAQAMWSEIAQVLSMRRGDAGAVRSLKMIERAMAGQPLTENQARMIANSVVLSLPLAAGRAVTPVLAQQ